MKIKEQLKEYRQKNIKNLFLSLQKEYQRLQELNFAAEFRKTRDIKLIKKTHQNIARIWTVLGEKMQDKVKEK